MTFVLARNVGRWAVQFGKEGVWDFLVGISSIASPHNLRDLKTSPEGTAHLHTIAIFISVNATRAATWKTALLNQFSNAHSLQSCMGALRIDVKAVPNSERVKNV